MRPHHPHRKNVFGRAANRGPAAAPTRYAARARDEKRLENIGKTRVNNVSLAVRLMGHTASGITVTPVETERLKRDGAGARGMVDDAARECDAAGSSGSLSVMVVLFARQLGAVCANGRDQFSRRDFVTHFAVNARFAFVDFDEKNAFTVFCRFEPKCAQFAPGRVVVLGEQGHCPGRPGGAHRKYPHPL
jgi:hypothetical protein